MKVVPVDSATSGFDRPPPGFMVLAGESTFL